MKFENEKLIDFENMLVKSTTFIQDGNCTLLIPFRLDFKRNHAKTFDKNLRIRQNCRWLWNKIHPQSNRQR